MYELTNRATGRTVIVTEQQLDILKGKNWMSRYNAPKPIAGGSTEAFVPEEFRRMKTSKSETEAVPVTGTQSIPELPAKNKKG